MTDTTRPADDEPARTRDYLKALLFVGLVVALMTLGVVLVISPGCGCTVPPPA